MKGFVIALAVASIAACVWYARVHALHTAPAIFVRLNDINDRWGGGTCLPAVEGFAPPGPGSSSTSMDGKTIYTAAEWYKVTRFPAGGFIVLAHYQIERNGTVENIDRALPVRDSKPAAADWSKVDDTTHACAYLTPGCTMSY